MGCGGGVTAEAEAIARERGELCHKGVPGCMCQVGWPSDEQCEDCRGLECSDEGRRSSRCICPPNERILSGKTV